MCNRKGTMKAIRINICRYLRPALVWASLIVLVYWFTSSDNSFTQTQKLNRHQKLQATKKKQLNGRHDEDGISLIEDQISDEDLEQNSGPDNEVINNSENTPISPEQFENANIDIEGPSYTKKTDERLSKVVETKTQNAVKSNIQKDYTKGNPAARVVKFKGINLNDEIRDDSDEDDNDGEPESGHPQVNLVVSALRKQVGNPLALRWNRLHWTISMAGAYSEKLFTPPPKELPQQRLPQAIIIGFGKCGTRALIDFMSIHPNIVTTGPEIHFYDVDENFDKGVDWYRAQMPFSYSNQITVEKTPSYIWSERAMVELFKLGKNTKLIVIMKNPVTRVVSQTIRSGVDLAELCMVMKDGQLKVNNDSRTVQWSIYSNYLQRWMRRFPRSQIHVLETTEFAKNPAAELRKIEVFLGVRPMITEENFYYNATKGYYCKRAFHIKEISCLSDAKGRKHPPLDPKVEKAFYDYFRGYNQELFRLLGQTYQWEPKS